MLNLEDVKQLLAQEGDILSLYLQVDGAMPENQTATPAWRSWLNNALRDLAPTISDERRADWDSAHDRALAFLQTQEQPHSKGLALFYGADTEQIYQLPIPLESNDIRFGKPLIAPLLWAIDEYEPYLVVLVDKEEARFIQIYLGSIEKQETIVSDRFDYDFGEKTAFSARPTGGGFGAVQGADQDKFNDMIDEQIAKLHRETAHRAHELMKQTGVERLIIAGAEKSAHAVQSYLHSEAAAGLAGVIAAPFYEDDKALMARITPVAQDYERQKEMELVEQVIDFAKSGGRGALGHKEVMDAMVMQQVETLIIPWSTDDNKLMRELPVRALENNVKIELVHGEAADLVEAEGGLAARLYYAIQPA